ncbi:MAG: accessory factor UbiK family protein [Alphaproteobacteria bacterium]|nr:accessory factor UbiK family protein [Alphaproteobacteria bacterium]
MQEPRKLIDDVSQVMGSSLEILAGIKHDTERMVKHQFQSLLSQQGLVTREEFEVVREMAAKAREENERLLTRIYMLEEKIREGKGE